MTVTLLVSIQQGLIFALLAMGVLISFRILDIADLSVEGSFPLGAFLFARFTSSMGSPGAMALSFLGGALAGGLTYFLYKKVKIAPILAGILTMTILYTVNLRVGGQSNIPLMTEPTIFQKVTSDLGKLGILLAIAMVIKWILDWFFKTEMGYLLTVTGDNEDLVLQLGENPNKYVCIGLVLSNALAGLSGCLSAQFQGYVDISMGQSMIVTALASLIIGETTLKKLPLKKTTRCILGAIFYRLIYGLALYVGLGPDDLKAVTGILVIVFIAYNNFGQSLSLKGGRHVNHQEAV